ncbi:hypothetical protein Mapa_010495 [Marchantia paleacea]|nr:hypothetical protein Mapa_010495 [Marchantia paleacea]
MPAQDVCPPGLGVNLGLLVPILPNYMKYCLQIHRCGCIGRNTPVIHVLERFVGASATKHNQCLLWFCHGRAFSWGWMPRLQKISHYFLPYEVISSSLQHRIMYTST